MRLFVDLNQAPRIRSNAGFGAMPYCVLYASCCSDPSGESMSRIRVREPLLHRISLSGPSGAADSPSGGCTAPACSAWSSSPRADLPVDLVRQVWGFSHGASQIGEGGRLAVLLPRVVEDYLRCRYTWNRHAHGLRLAILDGEIKCAEDFDEDRHHPPQTARRPRHDARVVSIQHPPNSTTHTFQCAVLGPIFDGCSFRRIRSASMSASVLNLSIA